jgi:Zn-dependent protease
MHGQANWSMSLGRWGGIAFRVHILFFLFAAVTVFLGWQQRNEHQDMPWIAIASISILFISVLLHELAHYFAATQFGGSGDEIVIWPLGGLAEMRAPYEPQAECLMHLAGPFVNLVLSLATGIVLCFVDRAGVFGLFNPLAPQGLTEAAATWILLLKLTCWINWVLLLVNLLPVFPFDGGRALRAGLCALWPDASPHRASAIVTVLAKGAALALVILAWFVQDQTGTFVPLWFSLVVLAIFLYFGAKQEAGAREEFDSEDDLFGYDFSQGYTSLEESSRRDEPQPGPFQRWLEERRAAKLEREREIAAEEERRADELLAQLHEKGMDSLSDEERSLLKRVSARYRQRHGNEN